MTQSIAIHNYHLACLSNFQNSSPFTNSVVVRTKFNDVNGIRCWKGDTIYFDYNLSCKLELLESKIEVPYYRQKNTPAWMQDHGLDMTKNLVKSCEEYIINRLINTCSYIYWHQVESSPFRRIIIGHPKFIERLTFLPENTIDFSDPARQSWHVFHGERNPGMRDNIDRYDIYICDSCEQDIGFIFYENALCVGYPRLPGMEPFCCGNVVDERTSISNRLYFGCEFGSGNRDYILDCLIGVTSIKDQVFILRIDE